MTNGQFSNRIEPNHLSSTDGVWHLAMKTDR